MLVKILRLTVLLIVVENACGLSCYECSGAMACTYSSYWARTPCLPGPNGEIETCYRVVVDNQVIRRGCTFGSSCANVPNFNSALDCEVCANRDLCNDFRVLDPDDVTGGGSGGDGGQGSSLICYDCARGANCQNPSNWHDVTCPPGSRSKCFKFIGANSQIEQLGCVQDSCENVPEYQPGMVCRTCSSNRCNADGTSGGGSGAKANSDRKNVPSASEFMSMLISILGLL